MQAVPGKDVLKTSGMQRAGFDVLEQTRFVFRAAGLECDGAFDVHTFNCVTEILPAVVPDSKEIEIRHFPPRHGEELLQFPVAALRGVVFELFRPAEERPMKLGGHDSSRLLERPHLRRRTN